MNNAKLGGKRYRKQCSYILQEDNLYATFNVQETMMLVASLKIAGISLEEKEQIVNRFFLLMTFLYTGFLSTFRLIMC